MSDIVSAERRKNLHEFCRNATNVAGDTFVGIKGEIIGGVQQTMIHFPLGYGISKEEETVRREILQLFMVLQEYEDNQSRLSTLAPTETESASKFPIKAYLTVIYYYMSNDYYQVKERNYTTGTSGNIHISRTLKKEKPIATKSGFVYLNYQVRTHSDTDKDLISEINKYCVYESILKIGWIYNLPIIPKPIRTKALSVYKEYLRGVWLKETKDNEKRLFKAMLDILETTSEMDTPEEFHFGTNRFEYIWEKLIQDTFGNVRKEDYFPRTKWILKSRKERLNDSIEPDTIMKFDGDIFVLDAKYYKYGWTMQPKDLPSSGSINKQISYGEYIATNEKFAEERAKGMEVFNAFLLPYDCQAESYRDSNGHYYYLGEAISEWKDNSKSYERVHGILVDVKFLIENAGRNRQKEIMKLSNKILEGLERINFQVDS